MDTIVMYGKGKVGESVVALCVHIWLDVVLMDDQDVDDAQLDAATYIVVTPGLKASHKIYTLFSAKILSELDFLAIYKDHFPFYDDSISIGITGTNGKSTTSWVLYNVLDAFFWDTSDIQCWLTGNFATPLSQVFLEILESKIAAKKHIFVIEASSFMLAHTTKFSYNYGVFLNISRDHLDRHDTMDKYIAAKENIVALSRQSFISESTLPLLTHQYPRLSVFENYDAIQNTHFVWDHNKQNLWAVVAVCSALSRDLQLTDLDVDRLLQDVYPLEHRLSSIRTIWNVTIVDDGICTSAAACKAALDAMSESCVLIAWWFDKWDNYLLLSDSLKQKASYIVVYGQVADSIAQVATDAHVSYTKVWSLQDAVQSALQYAQKNSIKYVLFSPAAASFDMFKNVYDRIEQFEKIVEAL